MLWFVHFPSVHPLFYTCAGARNSIDMIEVEIVDISIVDSCNSIDISTTEIVLI